MSTRTELQELLEQAHRDAAVQLVARLDELERVRTAIHKARTDLEAARQATNVCRPEGERLPRFGNDDHVRRYVAELDADSVADDEDEGLLHRRRQRLWRVTLPGAVADELERVRTAIHDGYYIDADSGFGA